MTYGMTVKNKIDSELIGLKHKGISKVASGYTSPSYMRSTSSSETHYPSNPYPRIFLAIRPFWSGSERTLIFARPANFHVPTDYSTVRTKFERDIDLQHKEAVKGVWPMAITWEFAPSNAGYEDSFRFMAPDQNQRFYDSPIVTTTGAGYEREYNTTEDHWDTSRQEPLADIYYEIWSMGTLDDDTEDDYGLRIRNQENILLFDSRNEQFNVESSSFTRITTELNTAKDDIDYSSSTDIRFFLKSKSIPGQFKYMALMNATSSPISVVASGLKVGTSAAVLKQRISWIHPFVEFHYWDPDDPFGREPSIAYVPRVAYTTEGNRSSRDFRHAPYVRHHPTLGTKTLGLIGKST